MGWNPQWVLFIHVEMVNKVHIRFFVEKWNKNRKVAEVFRTSCISLTFNTKKHQVFCLWTQLYGWKHCLRGIKTLLSIKECLIFWLFQVCVVLCLSIFSFLFTAIIKILTEARKQILFYFQYKWTHFAAVQFLWPFCTLSWALVKGKPGWLEKNMWVIITKKRNLRWFMYSCTSKPLLNDFLRNYKPWFRQSKDKIMIIRKYGYRMRHIVIDKPAERTGRRLRIYSLASKHEKLSSNHYYLKSCQA